MRRRAVLATGGAVLTGLSAGCLESFRREDAWRELVVDPPDGVYVPPHADEMVRYGTATADGRDVSLLASRPHSFWLVTGTDRERADIRSHHDVHLMVTVRDAETGAFVPAPVTTTIRTREDSDGAAADGDNGGGTSAGDSNRVDERSLWTMLSQRMGPHYGDNVSLEGDGAYTATVRIGATNADVIGGRADALTAETRVDLEFEYDAAEIEALERRLIDEDEGRGAGDALEPMAHAAGGRDGDGDGLEDRVRDLESVEALGTAASDGDADGIDYAAFRVDGDRIAVCAWTPYNAYPLPAASLAATVARDGETLASAPLRETVDARLGHCYATPADPTVLEEGDELTIRLETPPQVARHEGYETAFLESAAVSMALEDR